VPQFQEVPSSRRPPSLPLSLPHQGPKDQRTKGPKGHQQQQHKNGDHPSRLEAGTALHCPERWRGEESQEAQGRHVDRKDGEEDEEEGEAGQQDLRRQHAAAVLLQECGCRGAQVEQFCAQLDSRGWKSLVSHCRALLPVAEVHGHWQS